MTKEEKAISELAKECGYGTISAAVQLVDGAQDYLGENNFYPIFEQNFLDELEKEEKLFEYWEENSLFAGSDELTDCKKYLLFGKYERFIETHLITFFDGSIFEYEIKESKNDFTNQF